MGRYGYGYGRKRTYTAPVSVAPTLQDLTLSANTTPENSVAPAVIGSILGVSPGSTLSLADNAGGRFALSGSNLIRGATALDYEANTSHSVMLRETLAGATNTPWDSLVTVNVTNVVDGPSLNALGGTFTLAESASPGTAAGSITGRTSGSTLSLVNDAAGRVALLGTGIVMGSVPLDYETATSHSFTVRETLADSPNSPRDTVFTLNVTDIAEGGGSGTITTPVVIMASNLPGDAPPAWTIDFVDPAPDGATYGDTIRLWYATSEAGLVGATPVDEVLDDELIEEEGGTIAPALFAAEFDPWALAQTVGTTLWWQVAVIRTPGVEESDRSTPVSYAIVDGVPTATPFVDATNAALSTRVWSADITIAGLATGAYARFTVGAGGQMRVTRAGSGTPEAATTDEVQVQNGDKLAVSVVSSASNATAVNLQVFQRGVLYDTFTVTTVGVVGLDIQRVDQGVSGSGIASYTFTGKSLGTEDADRDILVMICGRDNTGVPTSVSIAGNAMAKREEVQSSQYGISLWTVALPTGVTGDLAITFPASQTRMGYGIYRMTGGNPVPVSTGETFDEVSGTTLTLNPTIGAGQILLAVGAGGTSGQTHSWSGATEEYEAFMSGTNISAFSLARNSTPGSPTLTLTYSGASTARTMMYAVFGA